MARLSSRLAAFVLAAATLVAVAVGPAKADSLYPTATLQLRTGPSDTFSSLGLVSENTAAHVIQRQGAWYQVSLPDGRQGWLLASNSRVVFDTPVTLDIPYALETHTGPSWLLPINGQLTAGSTVTASEINNGYYVVNLGAQLGYVDESRVVLHTVAPAVPPDQKRVLVLAAGTPVYLGRSTDYSRIDRVDPADSASIQYLGAREGWVHVLTPAGLDGWIDGQQVYLQDTAGFANQVAYDLMDGRWTMAYKPLVTITTSDGLNLRQGPSTKQPILGTYAQGAALKVLQRQDNWLRVVTSDGKLGWVDGTWTSLAAGGTPQVARAVLRTTPATDVLQLEVTGSFATAAIRDSAAQRTLTVGIADSGAQGGLLPVGEHGIASMSQGTQGVTLNFDGTYGYTVLDNSPGHVLIELRPHLTAVTYHKGSDDRRIFRFHVGGEVNATVHREGAKVILDLPGAQFDGAPVTPPPGMAVWQVPGGLRAQVTTPRAFELKRRAGELDLVFHGPGLKGKTIVLDPGHGGPETGAIGPTGFFEKDANLSMALDLRDLLVQAGATVIMTRSGDTRSASQADTARMDGQQALRYDLNYRTVIANTSAADLYLSIHSNGGPASAHGTATYFSSSNFNAYQSQRLAGLVQGSLRPALGTLDLGVGDDDFYVVTFTEAPAALVETAFITNPGEEALLKSPAFRAKVAKNLLPALDRFFQLEPVK